MEIKVEKKKNLITGWKILFRYLFERRKEVIVLSILGVFSGFANASVPYIIGQFFDALISPDLVITIATLTLTAWVLLGAWIFIQVVSNSVDWFIDIKNNIRIITDFSTIELFGQ